MKSKFIVLDFEANCSGNQTGNHEIIEFPCVLVDRETGETISEFHNYVKMITYTKLSDFIKNLTHITDNQVTNGLTWAESLIEFEKWCKQNDVTPENSTIVTCGDWDIKIMLANQLSISKTKLSPFLNKLFGCWTNVKIVYLKRSNTEFQKPKGMAAMLDELKIPLEGHHHSGIDDCRNIIKICNRLNQEGYDVTTPNRIRTLPFWYPSKLPYTRNKKGKIKENNQ